MGFRSNIAATSRGFYFDPDGNDSLSGRSLEQSVETPGKAIELTNLLDPPLSSQDRAAISSSASGIYSNALVLPDFTAFNAPSTSLITTDTVNVTVGESQQVNLGAMLNFSSGCTLFLVDGRNRIEANIATMIVGGTFATNCIGYDIRGICSDVFLRLTTGALEGDGATMINHTASAPTPVDYNIDSVIFRNTNQTLIDFNPPGVSDQASVNITVAQIDFTEITTGSMLFKVRAGRLIVKAEVLAAESVCVVEDGARLSLDAQIAFGDILIENGAIAVIKSIGILVGDITVDAGGELSITVSNHTGSVTCNGIINGWINGEPYGNAQEQIILMGSDFTNQTPTGTDAPLQIKFGSAQGSGSDPVQLSADGALTINKKKKYLVDVVVQYSRDNAGSAAFLFFRFKINGVQGDDSLFAKLDTPNNDIPVQLTARLDLSVGDVVTFEIMRDSAGFDDGEMVSTTPTPGDWNPAPSASIKVSI